MRRFYRGIQQNKLKKSSHKLVTNFDFESNEMLDLFKNYNVQIE